LRRKPGFAIASRADQTLWRPATPIVGGDLPLEYRTPVLGRQRGQFGLTITYLSETRAASCALRLVAHAQVVERRNA
jgi:hypothetical protein